MEYKFSEKLSALKPSAIREIFKSLTDPTIISFAAGNPNPLSFPVEALAKISADIFASDAAYALQYGITEGYAPLRESIAARIFEKFGIGREFDQTIVTTGGQQGIELACKAFCNEGDAVICENPSFIGALNAFRSNGARTIGVPLRADGIDLAILEETLRTEKKAKLLYLIPTFQNPSGITSTAENRHAVYALAKKYGVVILEDNPYGELRFAGADVPTYKSFDTDGIVIYCSSFSKILSSGMRIGFVNAPAEIIAKMVVAKQVEDVHTNLFAQMLCHRYMAEYDMDAHVAMIRELYRNKANRMLTALDAEMPQSVAYTRPEGGLFLWCTLPDGRDAAPFVQKFLENKVAVVPGSAFMCVENAPSDSFRLNYSMPSDEDIDRGVAILGKVLRDTL
ncbi:MAG: PLP-dependent aminotransferase family protein [Eubacteriales bacterium]|nr:PLP-dependent aminotransferase family protein [Clostridiales bacterium]MDD7775097.1 PLP-dependent aminotransferase family protein [Eubacteriales bacterium]MDY3941028.1 PLP-dependent aminotransferase family protein [Eubacteriales bacterium]